MSSSTASEGGIGLPGMLRGSAAGRTVSWLAGALVVWFLCANLLPHGAPTGVVLSGMPNEGADLSPVWFRELDLVGAYAASTERTDAGAVSTFDLAIDLARHAPLEGMVGAVYPLSRWRQALDHAFAAGRLGTVKVAFDPRR